MLIAIILGAITIAPIIILQVNLSIAFLLIFFLLLIADIVLYKLIGTLGVEWFRRLSD